MKLSKFAVHTDGDIELVFVTFGPLLLGLRLDKVPELIARHLRPQA